MNAYYKLMLFSNSESDKFFKEAVKWAYKHNRELYDELTAYNDEYSKLSPKDRAGLKGDKIRHKIAMAKSRSEKSDIFDRVAKDHDKLRKIKTEKEYKDLIEKSKNKKFSVLGTIATAASIGASGAGIYNTLKRSKFSVVYLTKLGTPHQATVSAVSPLDAVRKVNKYGGSKFRAFRLPDQDDQSQDYFESLKSQGSNKL